MLWNTRFGEQTQLAQPRSTTEHNDCRTMDHCLENDRAARTGCSRKATWADHRRTCSTTKPPTDNEHELDAVLSLSLASSSSKTLYREDDTRSAALAEGDPGHSSDGTPRHTDRISPRPVLPSTHSCPQMRAMNVTTPSSPLPSMHLTDGYKTHRAPVGGEYLLDDMGCASHNHGNPDCGSNVPNDDCLHDAHKSRSDNTRQSVASSDEIHRLGATDGRQVAGAAGVGCFSRKGSDAGAETTSFEISKFARVLARWRNVLGKATWILSPDPSKVKLHQKAGRLLQIAPRRRKTVPGPFC
ncbi:uncharacterized protein BJ171DRAFT_496336, partial [Polychytrium aggregatum]|uniref:uncharacterized protein n=1 Tax=Polychytrium aggregatum TaxID=110093 RepID=UPI0022FEB722